MRTGGMMLKCAPQGRWGFLAAACRPPPGYARHAHRLHVARPSEADPVGTEHKEVLEKVLQLKDEANIPQTSFQSLMSSLESIRKSASSTVGPGWSDPATLFLWSIPVGLGFAVLQGATPAQFWAFYLKMLEQHPFTTKIATGVTGAFLGDVLAQLIPAVTAQHQQQQHDGNPAPSQPWRYDIVRSGRFMLYSMLLGTPVVHFWYTLLDSVVMPSAPTAMTTVAMKVALDQLLMTPIMTCVFFTTMAAMEGKADQAWTLLKTKLVPTLKANYMLWPAAHCINFALIPGDQRILYVNCVALIWTVFLSSMAAGTVSAKPQPVTTEPLDQLQPEPVLVSVKRKVD